MTTIERPQPAVDPSAAAERVRAARALLLQPLLTSRAGQGDDLRLVRRHQVELTRLFAEGLGYRLVVEPGAARLFKTGLGRDGTRPLHKRSGAAFTPRAYALLCLTVAALTRSKAQLLVDELVAQVRSAAADAEMAVDLDASSDRRALHAALTALVNLGVLSERDGDLQHWADQRTQSLLDVHREILALLVAAPLSSARSVDEVLDAVDLPSAAGGARTAVRRRLVESPLLLVADLSEEQSEWWRRNRNREREWFSDRFGLDLELRAEGALAIDPDDELSDLDFPGRGGTSHLALLLLEQLATLARDASAPERPHGDTLPARDASPHDGFRAPAHSGGWRAIPSAVALREARDVLERWREGLRKDQQADPEAAVGQAMALLADLGLVRSDEATGCLLVHPAAARYVTDTTLADAAGSGEQSLFDLAEED